MLDTITTTTVPGATPDDAINLTVPESSRLLKRTLTEAFPGTKFRIRLSRGTGYGNCYVDWTDGPLTREVEAITAGFSGKGFDAMTDCSTYNTTRIMFDTKRKEWVRPWLGLILEWRATTKPLDNQK